MFLPFFLSPSMLLPAGLYFCRRATTSVAVAVWRGAEAQRRNIDRVDGGHPSRSRRWRRMLCGRVQRPGSGEPSGRNDIALRMRCTWSRVDGISRCVVFSLPFVLCWYFRFPSLFPSWLHSPSRSRMGLVADEKYALLLIMRRCAACDGRRYPGSVMEL